MMNTVLSLIVVIFMSTTIFFITKYTKILKLAQNEYVDAKNIVGAIIHHFRNHQDRQLQNVEHLSLKVDVVQTDIKNLSKEIKTIEQQIPPIKVNEDQRLNGNEEALNQLTQLEKKVESIIRDQTKLQDQMALLQTQSQDLKVDENRNLAPKPLHLSNLTDTERSVLQLIIKREANTSSDVERKIGKTREHTARLLRKLWQEGYIERDTHRIPYIYSVPENLKNGVSKKLMR